MNRCPAFEKCIHPPFIAFNRPGSFLQNPGERPFIGRSHRAAILDSRCVCRDPDAGSPFDTAAFRYIFLRAHIYIHTRKLPLPRRRGRRNTFRPPTARFRIVSDTARLFRSPSSSRKNASYLMAGCDERDYKSHHKIVSADKRAKRTYKTTYRHLTHYRISIYTG